REGYQLRAVRLHLVDRPTGGKATGEHDMADLVLRADVDQFGELRMHGDEVDAVWAARARLGLGDLGVEQFGSHRAAGDDSERAGVRQRGDQVALGNPAHRPAHDGDVT